MGPSLLRGQWEQQQQTFHRWQTNTHAAIYLLQTKRKVNKFNRSRQKRKKLRQCGVPTCMRPSVQLLLGADSKLGLIIRLRLAYSRRWSRTTCLSRREIAHISKHVHIGYAPFARILMLWRRVTFTSDFFQLEIGARVITTNFGFNTGFYFRLWSP